MDYADPGVEEARFLVDNAPIRGAVNRSRDVHVLSFAFLLIFLAYGAAQNLESTVNTVSLSSLCRCCAVLRFLGISFLGLINILAYRFDLS